ncbi:MAG TPA: hypothetical protein VEL10_02805 [Gaiellaceae bacterium]|nr:hypothetical protein [Gaiellaceae bacterium]
METIVVGVDGSDGACAVLEFAVGEAAVVDGSRVKVLAWYDGEWGYSNRLVELAQKVLVEQPALV